MTALQLCECSWFHIYIYIFIYFIYKYIRPHSYLNGLVLIPSPVFEFHGVKDTWQGSKINSRRKFLTPQKRHCCPVVIQPPPLPLTVYLSPASTRAHPFKHTFINSTAPAAHPRTPISISPYIYIYHVLSRCTKLCV